MSRKDGAIYHARNAVTAKLLRSDDGFYLLDFLDKGDGVCKRIASNRKLTLELTEVIGRVGWVEARARLDDDGRFRGISDMWLFHLERHSKNKIPDDVASNSEIESFLDEQSSVMEKIAADEDGRRLERLSAQADESERKKNAKRAADERAKLGKHCCTKCHKWMPKDNFSPSQSTKSGLRGWCMSCDSEFELAKAKAKEATQNKQQGDEKMTVKKVIATSSTAKSLREQAEMLLKQAEEVERVSSNELVMAEVRRVQLEIARSTAILSRVFGEAVDAMDMMEKASEELRKICQKK